MHIHDDHDLIIINHYMVIITMVDFIDFYASNLEVVGEYPITKIPVGIFFFSKVGLLFSFRKLLSN